MLVLIDIRNRIGLLKMHECVCGPNVEIYWQQAARQKSNSTNNASNSSVNSSNSSNDIAQIIIQIRLIASFGNRRRSSNHGRCRFSASQSSEPSFEKWSFVVTCYRLMNVSETQPTGTSQQALLRRLCSHAPNSCTVDSSWLVRQ